MTEGPPDGIEEGPESIPTSEEVESVFVELCGEEGFEEIRKCEDEEGLYLWDVMSGGDEYSYMRKGRYPEGQASQTAIHVTFYDETGTPVGGHSVAKYIDGAFKVTS